LKRRWYGTDNNSSTCDWPGYPSSANHGLCYCRGDGTTRIEQLQFGVLKQDRRALAEWAASLKPEQVVMESTGIYWKSPYAALEAVGIIH
jgi:hypothetical protein